MSHSSTISTLGLSTPQSQVVDATADQAKANEAAKQQMQAVKNKIKQQIIEINNALDEKEKELGIKHASTNDPNKKKEFENDYQAFSEDSREKLNELYSKLDSDGEPLPVKAFSSIWALIKLKLENIWKSAELKPDVKSAQLNLIDILQKNITQMNNDNVTLDPIQGQQISDLLVSLSDNIQSKSSSSSSSPSSSALSSALSSAGAPAGAPVGPGAGEGEGEGASAGAPVGDTASSKASEHLQTQEHSQEDSQEHSQAPAAAPAAPAPIPAAAAAAEAPVGDTASSKASEHLQTQEHSQEDSQEHSQAPAAAPAAPAPIPAAAAAAGAPVGDTASSKASEHLQTQEHSQEDSQEHSQAPAAAPAAPAPIPAAAAAAGAGAGAPAGAPAGDTASSKADKNDLKSWRIPPSRFDRERLNYNQRRIHVGGGGISRKRSHPKYINEISENRNKIFKKELEIINSIRRFHRSHTIRKRDKINNILGLRKSRNNKNHTRGNTKHTRRHMHLNNKHKHNSMKHIKK